MLRRSVFLFLCLAVFIGATIEANAATPDLTVSVTGSGTTIDDAKTDAIRQAMQLALRQLIVADRVISGDKILRDKVMSTMNGYVESFRIKGTRKTTGAFTVDVDITVSASRIENFLGVSTGGGGKFEGSPLLAEQNRRIAQELAEKGQQKARGEIFDRILRGFPSDAIALKVTHIGLADKDPKTLVLDIEYAFKANFLKALLGTLQELSSGPCEPQPSPAPDRLVTDIVPSNPVRFDCFDSTPDDGGIGTRPRSRHHEPVAEATHIVCLALNDRTQCYQLKKGNYCGECDIGPFLNVHVDKYLILWGRFVDDRGQSAGTRCLTSPVRLLARTGDKAITLVRTVMMTKSRKVILDLRSVSTRITLPSDDVDLSKASRFVAVAGLAGGIPFGKEAIKGATSFVKTDERNGCDLLDDAVRYQTLAAGEDRGAGMPSSLKKEQVETAAPRKGDEFSGIRRPRGRSWLGLEVRDASLTVVSVRPQSPAESVGIRPGDVIIALASHRLASVRELIEGVSATPIGTRVGITIMREGKIITLQPIIAASP